MDGLSRSVDAPIKIHVMIRYQPDLEDNSKKVTRPYFLYGLGCPIVNKDNKHESIAWMMMLK